LSNRAPSIKFFLAKQISARAAMTDSSFSPADAESLAAWLARAEANAAGPRSRLRDFGTDQRLHHKDRHRDPNATTAALTLKRAMDRISGNFRPDDLR
jgi:hypothetical protein